MCRPVGVDQGAQLRSLLAGQALAEATQGFLELLVGGTGEGEVEAVALVTEGFLGSLRYSRRYFLGLLK